MAKRKKEKQTYKYECSLTGEKYVLTQKVSNPEDLMSVTAWYDLNQEFDDRPLDVKKKIGFEQAAAEAQEIQEIE